MILKRLLVRDRTRARDFAYALSIIERTLNRGASAIVSIAMLFFVSPAEMGVYAGAMLVFTLMQSLGPVSLRQAGPSMMRQPHGMAAIRLTARLCAVALAAVSILYAGWVYFVGLASVPVALGVAALSVAGVASSLAEPRLITLQVDGKWGLVARRQTIAAAVSLVAGLALVPTMGIVGGIAQSVVLELLFLALLPMSRRHERSLSMDASVSPYRQVSEMSFSNVLAWMQTQSERVFAGLLAGPATLGAYSGGYQLGRSLAEPVATGFVTVLRTTMAAASAEDRQLLLTQGVSRSVKLGLALQLLTLCVLVAPLVALLPPEWHPAFYVGVLLSAGLPMMLSLWVFSTLIVVRMQTRKLFVWQLIGVAMSASAGALMTASMLGGVGIILLRDVVGLVGRSRIVWDAVGWSDIAVIVKASALSFGVSGLSLALLVQLI